MQLRGILAFVLISLMAAGPVAMPTMEQIQQAYDAGQYQDVIKKVAPVLSLKGDAAAGYDKSALLALKAESHVRLRQFAMASDAFAAAAKETTDDRLGSTYRATAVLIKRSQTGKYQPRQPTTQQADPKAKPEPIDIVEPASRKLALAALYNDESKVVLDKVESFKKQQSLMPVMNAIKQVSDLRALELAGTDSTEMCKAALASLGGHANQLMATAIKTMSDQTEKLATTANESRTEQRHNSNGTIDNITRKRGLISTEKNTLQDVVNTCKSIVQACDELSVALGADGAALASSREAAATLGTRAEEVLKTNYEPVVTPGSTIVTPGTPRPGYK